MAGWYSGRLRADGWQEARGNDGPAQAAFSKRLGNRGHAMAVIGSAGDSYRVRYRIDPAGRSCPYNW